MRSLEKNVGLISASYIDEILIKYNMQDSKKKFVPFRVGKSLSSSQRSKTSAEIERMRGIPYASAVGSLMYAMLCTRLYIWFAVGMVSRYQSEPGEEHWIAVKHILKYLRRT